jgi:uncharacterized protein YhbP (UPF0306 family)
MNRDELESTITAYMDSLTTMTLACCAAEKPWAAAVYYARMGLDLVFFSSPSSRHSLFFDGNSAAAATIQGCYEEWRDIKGLQLEGRVSRIDGAKAKVRALSVYLHRFPFAAELLGAPESISLDFVKKMSKVRLYLFATDSVFYLDNSIGFGTRWKMTVKKGRAVGEPACM